MIGSFSFSELQHLRSLLDRDYKSDMFEREDSNAAVQRVLELTNEARSEGRQCGSTWYPATTPLTSNDLLNKASAEHASDMVAQNYFEHTGMDGRSPSQRMTDAGYEWCASGENISCDSTADNAVKAWLKSPGHCANIMNGDFKDLGIGYARGGSCGGMWVQNFGKTC